MSELDRLDISYQKQLNYVMSLSFIFLKITYLKATLNLRLNAAMSQQVLASKTELVGILLKLRHR